MTQRFAVVYTRESSCRCGPSILSGLSRLGHPAVGIAVEDLGRARDAIRTARLVFEHIDRVGGRVDLRPLARERIASWGGRLAGSGPRAARAADDKVAARARLERAGLAVARGVVVALSDLRNRGLRNGRGAGPIRGAVPIRGLRFPLVLKLPLEHGSRGVRLIRNRKRLRDGIDALATGRGRVLIEEYIRGTEIAATVVERGGQPFCLPLVRIDLPRGAIYTRGRKWGRGRLPIRLARLRPKLDERVRRAACDVFRALGLSDYARIDLRVGRRGAVRILEANVRPSVEPGTELRLALRAARCTFPRFLAGVIESAEERLGVHRR